MVIIIAILDSAIKCPCQSMKMRLSTHYPRQALDSEGIDIREKKNRLFNAGKENALGSAERSFVSAKIEVGTLILPEKFFCSPTSK